MHSTSNASGEPPLLCPESQIPGATRPVAGGVRGGFCRHLLPLASSGERHRRAIGSGAGACASPQNARERAAFLPVRMPETRGG